MRRFLIVLAIACAGCGGKTAVAPSPLPVPTPTPAPMPSPSPIPQPAPSRIAIAGTITDTVSGAVIGSFSEEAAALPASVTVSAPGHLTRQTRVGSATPTVDLIPTTPPFSAIFYGQLVRDMLESPTPEVVHTLPAAPAIYLQTTNLSSLNAVHMVAAVRDVLPLMTGGRFSATTIETGNEVRPERDGWIVMELVNEPDSGNCGRAYLGRIRGHIWMNVGNPVCTIRGDVVTQIGIRHELGHALGFFHIDVPNSLMNGTRSNRGDGLPTDGERYHAAIAYRRQAGNRDPDIDASTSTPLAAREHSIIIVD
jgi:hypothetical protein